MTTNKDIVDFARTQLDVPWIHMGRSPGIALDCAGLVIATCRHFNLPFNDIPVYGMRPDGYSIKQILDNNAIRTQDDPLEPGRIAVFWIRKATMEWQHLGIVVEKSRIIHGHSRRDRIVENTVSGSWSSRLVATYRFREVDYSWLP